MQGIGFVVVAVLSRMLDPLLRPRKCSRCGKGLLSEPEPGNSLSSLAYYCPDASSIRVSTARVSAAIDFVDRGGEWPGGAREANGYIIVECDA